MTQRIFDDAEELADELQMNVASRIVGTPIRAEYDHVTTEVRRFFETSAAATRGASGNIPVDYDLAIAPSNDFNRIIAAMEKAANQVRFR